MHKTRFIWLKNPSNLTERQAHRLGELQRLNLKINRAYLLKELFRHFWEYRRGGWAKRYLKKWFWWATHSRLKPMRDFAWMLRRRILNTFALGGQEKCETRRNPHRQELHPTYHCLGNQPHGSNCRWSPRSFPIVDNS